MHRLKPILTGRIVLALTFLFLGFLIFFSLKSEQHKPPDLAKNEITLKIADIRVTAEVVETKERLIQGLSGRKSLEENSGMYFVLPERKIATFWMKGMLFPLDIIWIDDGVIVDLDENIPIPTKDRTPSLTSPQEVTHVLEVNAGFVNRHNIETGNTVEIAN